MLQFASNAILCVLLLLSAIVFIWANAAHTDNTRP